MLAANIWHWWVGLVLTVVGIGAVAAVGAGYVKQVSASRFPRQTPTPRPRRGLSYLPVGNPRGVEAFASDH